MSLTGQLLSASKYLESQLGGVLGLEAGQLDTGPKSCAEAGWYQPATAIC